MAAEVCTACKVERYPIEVEPLAGRYEVRCFRCPHCETVLRLACASEDLTQNDASHATAA
jgi:hypothetical protein